MSDTTHEPGPSAAELQLATSSLSELQKAVRFYRLYPKTHLFCVKSSTDSLEFIQRYATKYGKLSVEVQRDGLYMGEECVLSDSGQSTDISTLLYPEGVFGLAFLTAVTNEEISDLCETLAASYIAGKGEDEEEDDDFDEDEDLLGALWDHEFEGIQLMVQDPLSPAFEPSGDGPIARISTRIRTLVAEFHDEIEFSGQWEARAGDHKVEAFIQGLLERSPTVPEADPEKAASFLLSGEGRRRAALAAELTTPAVSDPGRAVQIVKWAIKTDLISGMDEAELARIRMNAIVIALANGQLDDAIDACVDLAGENYLTKALTRRVGSFKSLRGVAQGLEALDGELDKNQLIERGLRYLDLLDPATAMAPACKLYPDLANGNVRRVFRRMLSANAAEHCAAIEPITLHDEEGIVKEAVGILAMGGKGSKSWELLKTLAKDTENEYRSGLAQQVVGMVSGTKESEKLIKVLLNEADEALRISAAKKLARVGMPVVFDRLVEYVKRPAFGSLTNSEINAVFNALSKTGGVRSIVVLQELGKKKLFSRGASGRLRTLSTNWLQNKQADRIRKKKYGR